MMNKKGISALVATVLTILITVAGIGIIWVAIVPMIQENIEFDALDGRVTVLSSGGYTVYDADKEVAIVQVKRDVDEGVMNRIKIMFLIDGNSYSSNVVAPGSGQTKTYSFDLSGYSEPESVSVAAIFVSGSGSEKEGSVSSNVDFPLGKISEVDADVYELGRDYFYEMPMTGLVSWWKFDDESNIGKDSVGGNDGVWSDNITREDGTDTEPNGIVDGVLVLDGDGDYVDIPNNPSFDNFNDTGLTLGLWFKTNNISHTQNLISRWGGVLPGAFMIQYNSAKKIRFMMNNGTAVSFSEYSNNAQINNNEWHHVVIVYTPGTTLQFYFDSEEIGSYVLNSLEYMWDNNKNITLGHDQYYAPGDLYFDGSMDDVMIYEKALSEEEVAAIYENQKKD